MPLTLPDYDQSRYFQIDANYQATLEWLFEDPNTGFTTWLSSNEPMFWIKGLPGSGKSTAMKFIFDNDRTVDLLPSPRSGSQAWLKVGIFFSDRGSEAQKTFDGLLRSALFQILRQSEQYSRDLITLVGCFGVQSPPHQMDSLLRSFGVEKKRTVRPQSAVASGKQEERNAEFEWSVDKLQDALKAVIEQKKVPINLLLLVDALDEHSGDYRQIARFLRNLPPSAPESKVKMKVLVASRDENAFADVFMNVPILEIHRWTRGDIQQYIAGKLSSDTCMKRFLASPNTKRKAQMLMAEVVDRARGVFLWVRLVVDDLLAELERHPLSLDDLSELLDGIPNELRDYYRKILHDRIQAADCLEAYILLEVVLRHDGPPTITELAHICDHAKQKLLRKGPYFDFVLRSTDVTANAVRDHCQRIAEGSDNLA